MSTRITLIVSLILILSASLAGALLWERLPDQVASHWNEHNQVDGYTSKFWGVFLMPLVTLGMLALFLVIPSIDPLKANIAQFREAFNLFITLIIAFMVYIHALTLAWNLGCQDFEMSKAMFPAMGLLFLFVGYLLRKAKRNWFIGIRTPWTLSSDRVWDQTHRLGSILFIACGILTIVGGFFSGSTAFWLLFAPLLGSVIFLAAYSYALYRRETRP